MIELKYATDLQGELDLMKMCNCFSCKRAIDLIERIDGLMRELKQGSVQSRKVGSDD
jgi:hypothetical protein